MLHTRERIDSMEYLRSISKENDTNETKVGGKSCQKYRALRATTKLMRKRRGKMYHRILEIILQC